MENNEQQPLETNLRILILRNVCVGHVVTTSKGFQFKLVSRDSGKESWLDIASGLTWHDREDESYTHHKAVEKFGDSLPTIEEYRIAEKHGFREILPNMDHWFWSSSLYPSNADYAQDFVGTYGSSGYGVRDSNFYSVRCVGR